MYLKMARIGNRQRKKRKKRKKTNRDVEKWERKFFAETRVKTSTHIQTETHTLILYASDIAKTTPRTTAHRQSMETHRIKGMMNERVQKKRRKRANTDPTMRLYI